MSADPQWQTLIQIANAQTVRGIPPLRPLIPYRNIGALVSELAQRRPQQEFLIYLDESGARQSLTFRAFQIETNRLANLLASRFGVRKGQRIATLAHNHSDVLLLYFAAWRIGATVAPQNPAEDDRRIGYVLRDARARLVFALDEYRRRAENIRRDAPVVEEIVALEPLRADAAVESPDRTASDAPARDDEALLVYTSGTTGAPKGVVLNHYNLMVNADSMARWDQWTAADRAMTVLPIHHVNGIVVTHIAPLVAGASTVLTRQFSSRTFWRTVAEERVTVVSVVPTLLQFLMEADEHISRYDLSHLRYLICGAGTLSVSLASRFEARFGVPLVHGYGLSETTAYACHLPVDLSPAERRHWLSAYGYPSIGCALDVNEMAIFDSAGEGKPMPDGERGEIAVRGHNVMQGYLGLPEANRETFRYGWFRTGDEGFAQSDERGRRFFFITGRLKELINRGGVKFSPLDIEEVLLEIPGVRTGLAIAFENIYYGEEIGAFVIAEPGTHLDPQTVLDHCRARLGFEKSPKAVVFGQEAPVTATGKYQRLLLRHHFDAWRETQFRNIETTGSAG